MKKAFCALVILAVLVGAAWAEGRPMSEIQAEIDGMNLQIWQSQAWSSVIVPQGRWRVGKDIPAGDYHVMSVSKKASLIIWVKGETPDDYWHLLDGHFDDWVGSEWSSIHVNEGDVIDLDFAGLRFISDGYKPSFSAFGIQANSANDLQQQYDALCEELRRCPEWEEVTVPAGLYQVGTQIPAGRWTIWPEPGMLGAVQYGQYLTSDGDLAWADSYGMISATRRTYDIAQYIERVSIDCEDGWYIKVPDKPVVFTPYAGPVLFKFEE